MLRKSRIDIYNYLYTKLHGVVTKNVYSMNEPQELTESDTKDGFVVIRVGDLNDESEFSGAAYGWARVFIEAYVPPKSRGRLDKEKYVSFENGINAVIENASSQQEGIYGIQEGSIISMDAVEETNANNNYFMFVKSFILTIDEVL